MNDKLYELDVACLKQDLYDYFGTAMTTVSPIAIMELMRIENATLEELIEIAQKNNFNIDNYLVKTSRRCH